MGLFTAGSSTLLVLLLSGVRRGVRRGVAGMLLDSLAVLKGGALLTATFVHHQS